MSPSFLAFAPSAFHLSSNRTTAANVARSSFTPRLTPRAPVPSTIRSHKPVLRMVTSANSELSRLIQLPLPDDIIVAEYVWLDGNYKLRSKARTVDAPVSQASDLPDWNYDGSSTNQASGDRSEVILKPRVIYRDPFRGEPHILVMCDTYTPEDEPLITNTRAACDKVMSNAESLVPWFGLEQEYFLINPQTGKPLGFPTDGSDPPPQGPYYCGVGAQNAFGREVADAAWRAQLYAGLKVGGINAEVAPGQWEFQVGPCVGIEEGDMMWMARYILERVAEIAGFSVNYEPKPVEGDWNGSGCHTNFSTKPMREEGGYEKAIIPALERLKEKHREHIEAYGEGNDLRLTGKHETAHISEFRWGVADRGASCRVGASTARNGKGYFEDRRPAGNCDPYVVTKLLLKTGCDISED